MVKYLHTKYISHVSTKLNFHMKNFLFLLSVIASFTASLYAGEINYVYPPNGSRLPNSLTKTFVFGNISPYDMPFTLNGEKVNVHTNGGFIAYVPVIAEDNNFVFKGELADGTTSHLIVGIIDPSHSGKDNSELWLTINSVYSDMEVLPGDPIKIQAKGTPLKEAFFSIEGLVKDAPMTEYPEGSGRYYGVYWTQPDDAGRSGTVTVRFKTGFFRNSVQSGSKGLVKVLNSPVLFETISESTVLKTATDGGYAMFLDKGIKLISNGKAGNMRRISLSNNEVLWVEDSKVAPSESRKLPIPPFTEAGTIGLKSASYGTDVSVTLFDKVPYVVEETDFGIKLRLYYTNVHTNWIVYDSSDTLVNNVTFRQAGENVSEINIYTSEPVWGYYISYIGTSLKLQLRKKPIILMYWPKPLVGLNVVVDAGHSPKLTPPYDGAIGPKASFEFQVNLAIAKKLRDRLIDLGATVKMIREEDETVALADRPKIAKEASGDLYISVHNNALGDGKDPFNPPLGFEIYYYHKHSRNLASAIHKQYRRNIALPDQGLRFGDYLVCRMTWMPVVLTETAYMIIPQQEEMLNTPEFQNLAAKSMAEGILSYFNVPPEPPKTVLKRKETTKLQKKMIQRQAIQKALKSKNR